MTNKDTDLLNALKGITPEVIEDEPLANYTTFGIGGNAKFLVKATSTQSLVGIVSTCIKLHSKFFILGNGSNILVSDKGFDGVVILNKTNSISRLSKNTLYCDSGVILSKLVNWTVSNLLTGIEFASTIPGTIGGAIVTNARVRDIKSHSQKVIDFRDVKEKWISDDIVRIKILNPNQKILELSRKDCKFYYQSSMFSMDEHFKNCVILGAIFHLQPCKEKTIKEKISRFNQFKINRSSGNEQQPEDTFTKRRPKQPKEKSAGCIFSNIPNPYGHPAGRLIDLCGLRGLAIEDAQISEDHANFFINKGKAKASEIKELINLCKARVYEKFGISLIEEINYIGEFEK